MLQKYHNYSIKNINQSENDKNKIILLSNNKN